MEQEKSMQCVRCGATAVIDGSLLDPSSGGSIYFRANEVSFMKRMFSLSNRKIKAYACLHCSHLELMVEFTDKDRKRFQDFDGPQPGVLDRIAGNEEN
jgi:hypothetical protein